MNTGNLRKRIAVIGAGFSGLSAAAYAAKSGNEIHLFEKHHQPGGRARQFKTDEGYVFDMGPSWYWMPDIIEGFSLISTVKHPIFLILFLWTLSLRWFFQKKRFLFLRKMKTSVSYLRK